MTVKWLRPVQKWYKVLNDKNSVRFLETVISKWIWKLRVRIRITLFSQTLGSIRLLSQAVRYILFLYRFYEYQQK